MFLGDVILIILWGISVHHSLPSPGALIVLFIQDLGDQYNHLEFRVHVGFRFSLNEQQFSWSISLADVWAILVSRSIRLEMT